MHATFLQFVAGNIYPYKNTNAIHQNIIALDIISII